MYLLLSIIGLLSLVLISFVGGAITMCVALKMTIDRKAEENLSDEEFADYKRLHKKMFDF